ncbi:PadR family transcriptional regulator [Cellulomonas sp.]|uniref:PadR family transcriptional regulator n=1 Tax=Cellulomonas sp. TaxID=40001 RepID=UPI002811B096|nr:PadR family transcriptional regulator [Cellulomonas sp.]
MSRRAQTDVAVLGALTLQPMTGYALRAAIVDTLGHFWSESFGQIYPTLARLTADGLVTKDDDGRFTLTPAGRTHLRTRLAEPYDVTPPRNPLLLRLFFGRALGRDACRALLRDTGARATAQLAALGAVRAEIAAEPPSPDHPYALVTLDYGERMARAHLEWVEASLRALDTPDDRAPASVLDAPDD